MRIAILTVFYKPLIDDIKNFIEISKSFQGRFCFINSKLNQNKTKLLKSNNIIIFGNGSNLGLSKAYNYILKECLLNNFNLCFITDQDSKYKRSIVDKFLNSSVKFFNSDKYLAITSMSPSIGNKNKLNKKKNFSYKNFVINSGSLISCSIWQKIGMYDENLFIDMVDYDFCQRLKNAGLKIIQFDKYRFEHSIGKLNKYLFNLFSYNSYTHQRHFHIIKDRLYFTSK